MAANGERCVGSDASSVDRCIRSNGQSAVGNRAVTKIIAQMCIHCRTRPSVPVDRTEFGGLRGAIVYHEPRRQRRSADVLRTIKTLRSGLPAKFEAGAQSRHLRRAKTSVSTTSTCRMAPLALCCPKCSYPKNATAKPLMDNLFQHHRIFALLKICECRPIDTPVWLAIHSRICPSSVWRRTIGKR